MGCSLIVKDPNEVGLNPLVGIATSNLTKCGPGPNLQKREFKNIWNNVLTTRFGQPVLTHLS
jgi:hypothetical protein